MVAVIVGLFFAGLAYLQYNQIANINWNKLQTLSEGAITTISNLTMQIPAIGNSSDQTASYLAMTSSGFGGTQYTSVCNPFSNATLPCTITGGM
jgi:uncharacterized membrane protein (Fun14 family)